jgi:hypothetical protein
MSTPEELCRKLKSVCMLVSDEDARVYTQVVDELAESRNPATLPDMMLCLRDVDAGEIQYELLEACERFPKEVFVDSVIAVGAECLQVSPIWFGMLLQSLLNTSEYRALFVNRFKCLDAEAKLVFLDFFKRLAARNSKYQELVLYCQS